MFGPTSVMLQPGLGRPSTRKRTRTRRLIGDAALRPLCARRLRCHHRCRRYATTPRSRCRPSTRYFPSKEAAAFPDDDTRANQVAATLSDAPSSEPPHRLLRAASLNLAKYDQAHRGDVLRRLEVIANEPALGAYAARRQAEHTERFTALLAARLHVDPLVDLRPRLAVATAMAAVSAAWAAWLNNYDADLGQAGRPSPPRSDAGLAHLF